MNVLFLDYETYWADDFSLSKMPMSLYIRDPRFKCHGCAVAYNDGPSEWVTGRDLPAFFAEVAPHIGAVCAHNGAFDHSITAQYFTKKRFFLLDTLSMAQSLLANRFPDLSMSLDALGKHFFPNDPNMQKFAGFIQQTKGLVDLPPHLEGPTATYAKRDNNVCRSIFRKMVGELAPHELEAIDLTLAMQVYPILEMDTALAELIYLAETERKEDAADALGIDRDVLRSDECFADLLRGQGVDPPMKISARTGLPAYAFAKSDHEFKKLANHDDPMVCELVAARLGERAAQMEKRAAMFMRLPSPMPVPLAYAKAHTGRHAGEQFNLQNLKRGSELRRCIRAPKGNIERWAA